MRFLLKFLIISFVFSIVAIISARHHHHKGSNNELDPNYRLSTQVSDKEKIDTHIDSISSALTTIASLNLNELSDCSNVASTSLHCDFNYTCIYGSILNANCSVLEKIDCVGKRRFEKEYKCYYCYQLPISDYTCSLSSNCRDNNRYLTNCTVNANVLCLGKRVFPKYLKCNFVSGYRWSTALILSITLGGFGVDRFYLGNWQEGIGKLFSFGGLGVWTTIDIILIATGYLKPADGSRYM